VSTVTNWRDAVRPLFVFVIGLSVIGLSACGEKPQAPPPLRLVKAFTVGDSVESSVTPSLGAAGVLEKNPEALGFDGQGRVIALLVKTGESVAEGQALARLDPTDLALAESSAKVQFRAAQAELNAAEADFRRFNELHQKGFISAADIERRRAQLELARARFEATSDQLGFLTLRAIRPGVVTGLRAAVGDMVSPRQVVVQLKVTGLVSRPAASNTRGVFIPLSAVMDGRAVFRIKPQADDKAVLERVEFRPGVTTEQSVQVLGGLSKGDRIVAAGTQVLSDGQTVRVGPQ
jgi:multidrug efflux pump subunit AcrA (membrane-fusion protein)